MFIRVENIYELAKKQFPYIFQMSSLFDFNYE